MVEVTEGEIIKNKIPLNSIKDSFIYFLIDNSRIVYVGQTTTGMSRILAHCSSKEFDSYFTIQCLPDGLNKMESNYIYKFNPKYNISLPLNEKYLSKSQLKKQYRVDGHAMRKVISRYGVSVSPIGCYDRDEVEKALRMARRDNILRYSKGTNSDWFINYN